MDIIGIIIQLVGYLTNFIDTYQMMGVIALGVGTMILFVIIQAGFEMGDKILKLGMIAAVIVFIAAFLYQIGFAETTQETYAQFWEQLLSLLKLK